MKEANPLNRNRVAQYETKFVTDKYKLAQLELNKNIFLLQLIEQC